MVASEPGGPRRLGDAWRGWDGRQASAPARTDAGPGLLLSIHLLLVLAATLAWIGLLWLAEPRLRSLGLPAGPWLALRLALPVALAVPWLGTWVATAGLPVPAGAARLLARWLVALWGPSALAAACLGVSRDRLGHAFVAVTNCLALRSRRVGAGGGMLVLAPRCLRPDLLRALRGLAEERGAAFVVATGGEEARAAVGRADAGAILAVACERDLVAGLREVLAHRTVLGLANRRPEGPCRNSEVDLDEARRCLERLERLTHPSRSDAP